MSSLPGSPVRLQGLKAAPSFQCPVAWAGLAALVLTSLAGCGEPKVADLSYATLRAAINQGEPAFEQAFASVKGQIVRWKGRVTEVLRQRGDDYVEEAYMSVDFDPPGTGSEEADATFKIPVSKVSAFVAGQEVTVLGVIREHEKGPAGPVLKIELREVK
jgi:hypothetical protein